MKTIYLSGQKFEYELLSELLDEFSKRKIKIGDGCKIGDECEIDKSPFYATGLYKYHVSAHYNQGVPYIQMGCFLRTLKEWQKDFWNNTQEFPNDPDNIGSQKRLFAFSIAKKWIQNNKP